MAVLQDTFNRFRQNSIIADLRNPLVHTFGSTETGYIDETQSPISVITGLGLHLAETSNITKELGDPTTKATVGIMVNGNNLNFPELQIEVLIVMFGAHLPSRFVQRKSSGTSVFCTQSYLNLYK
jgi:hypothetical protein